MNKKIKEDKTKEDKKKVEEAKQAVKEDSDNKNDKQPTPSTSTKSDQAPTSDAVVMAPKNGGGGKHKASSKKGSAEEKNEKKKEIKKVVEKTTKEVMTPQDKIFVWWMEHLYWLVSVIGFFAVCLGVFVVDFTTMLITVEALPVRIRGVGIGILASLGLLIVSFSSDHIFDALSRATEGDPRPWFLLSIITCIVCCGPVWLLQEDRHTQLVKVD